MITGIMQVELFIPDSGSLKSKRFALKSLKERIKSRFNVSVAEVDNADKWQRATLGVVTVSNESRHVESMLGNVIKFISGDMRVELLDSTIRYV